MSILPVKKDKELETIVRKIITLHSIKKELLIEKFNIEWLIHELTPDILQLIELKFIEYGSKGVDIVNFVMIFLSMLNHQEYETLYITMGLVDMFKELAENNRETNYVKYTDVTWMLVDVNFCLLFVNF